jgi:5-methyltetrahydrofolate--homocysteine methyltransferase
VRDAAEATSIAAALLRGEDFEREQERLRGRFAARMESVKLLTLAEARARATPFDPAGVAPPPRHPGVRAQVEDLVPLLPLIDWTPFFRAWGFDRVYPAVLDNAAACALWDDAHQMLARIIEGDWLQARSAVGLFRAQRDGDDIVIADRRVPFLRQQMAKTAGRANLCLADFVAERGDHVGVFAVTAGLGVEEQVHALEEAGETHDAILLRTLADRLVEALAERLHARVREELWGFPGAGIRPAPGYPACPDHSLKQVIFDLLGRAAAGMSLSETGALSPAASIAGFYLAHPAARYFGIGRIGRDQVADYAARTGIAPEEAERRLAPVLGYRR